MARTTMEIVLSEELKDRITLAAQSQDKSVRVFIQDALYTYVEDIEDGVMADVALTEEGRTFFSAEREHQRALDHSVFEASRKTA